MNTFAMAKAYIEDAERSYNEAKINFNEKAYHRCIRRAQECVELSLKGVLRLLSIEYPKSHDVSIVLDKIKKETSIPNWFQEKIEDLKRISVKLAMERGPAFYGDERAFIPPEELYSKEDAEEALEMARYVLTIIKKFLEEYKVS
ncbi:MAG: HEPN domain-containing protein [Nitrososphaerota archaeon]